MKRWSGKRGTACAFLRAKGWHFARCQMFGIRYLRNKSPAMIVTLRGSMDDDFLHWQPMKMIVMEALSSCHSERCECEIDEFAFR